MTETRDTDPRLEELVLRAIARDEEAFTELVKMFSVRLKFYIRKIVEDDDYTEDVLQTVWIEVYKKISTLRSTKAFPVWLYRIARNHSMRAIRKIVYHRKYLTSPVNEIDTIANGGDADDGFSTEDVSLIRSALKKLKAEHQEVLTLRYLEDMTYEQIATVTSSNLGTVRSRLYYAKIALREAVESEKNNE